MGAKADANLISQIGGLTSQGISMHGLSQAASYYGIQLTGLHLDAGQLKPNDIILLNINGNNHYALILGKIGDNYIIQDPYLGTVIMTTEQFNKYYTGNTLTTNPNGRGTTLSIEEMKNLFGGVGEVEVATGIGTGLMGVGAGFSWTGVGLILLAVGAVIVAGVAIYKADEYYSQKYPELNKPLPSYAPFGYKISMGIALDIINLASSSGLDSKKPEENTGTFIGKLMARCDVFPFPLNYVCKIGAIPLLIGVIYNTLGLNKMGITPDKIIDSIWNVPNNFMSWLNSLGSNDIKTNSYGDYTMNNTSFNLTFNNTSSATWRSRLMMISPGIVSGAMNAAGNFAGWASGKINEAKAATSSLVNGFKAAAKDAYNRVVQPALDRFNSERVEFQKKGLVKYAQSKYVQAKSYVKEKAYYVKKVYDTHLKPIAQKYIKPATHKILDPVWNHPATQWVVKNVPGVKTITNGLGWIGNKLGIW